MKLDSAIVEHINSLKIVRPNLGNLGLKQLEDIYTLLSTKLNRENQQEAVAWFNETLKENPDIKLIYFFIAISNFLYAPNGELIADQNIEFFFRALEKANNTKLVERICNWLYPQVNSTIVLEYLAKQLKADVESKPQSEEKYTQLLEVYRKLLSKKTDDLKLVEVIADLLDSKNDTLALFYYRTLLEENQKLKSELEVLRLWQKLLASRVAGTFTEEKSSTEWLLQILNPLLPHLTLGNREHILKDYFQYIVKHEQPDKLSGFKLALENQIFLPEYFQDILKHWNSVYQNNHCYQLFVKLSGLKKTINLKPEQEVNSLKLLQQIEEFEKLISLDEDRMILHRTFGLGIIKKIIVPSKLVDETNVRLSINFTSKPNHEMSLRIAATSLEPCYRQHLIGLKYFFPEKFSEIMSLPPEPLLLHILKSIGKDTSLKELKKFLIPEVFTENQWKQKWKEIKPLLSNMNSIHYANSTLSVLKPELEIELPHLGNELPDKAKPKTLDSFKEELLTLEKVIGKANDNDHEQLLTKIADLENQLQAAEITNKKECLFSTLAIAYRAKKQLKPEWLQEANDYLANSTLEVALNTLVDAYLMLQTNSSRNALLTILETHLLKESYLNFCIYILNKTTGQQDFILEHLLNDKKGNGKNNLSAVFEHISKEYLTSADTYIALLKLFFDKNQQIIHETMNQVFIKMIKLLQKFHLNIDFSSGKKVAKKNYSTLNRLLFEDEHLFRYLSTTKEIELDEKISTLKQLQEMTFLSNDIKRKVRELHTTLGQN